MATGATGMHSRAYFDELTDEELLAYGKALITFTPDYCAALMQRFEDLLFDQELSSEPEHKDLLPI